MFIVSFLRVIKFSIQDIARNIWLSIATIMILILALFSVNMLLTVDLVSKAAIESIRNKIDVNLYINPSADENAILALKAEISNINQVKDVTYISKDEAMNIFQQRHQNNPEILEALRELGENPLTPALVIKPKNIDQYDSLINALNAIDNPIIQSRNFEDHKALLEKVNNISHKVSEAGLIISGIFILITLLVVYNAIRVAIYTHRKEIGIMRLVGASNWFVRAPFLFSSVIYAFIGVLAIILIFYPFLSLLQPYLEAFFIDYQINLISFFNSHFLYIFGLEFLGAVAINGIASLIAVGKYSRV